MYNVLKYFKSMQDFFGSFRTTEQWVPDLLNPLKNNQLKNMMDIRENVIYDEKHHLAFNIGKPRLIIKQDQFTQTDEALNTELGTDILFYVILSNVFSVYTNYYSFEMLTIS